MAEVVEVEEVVPGGGDLVHEDSWEIIEPDVIVKEDSADWDLEGIMMTKEVNTSALRSKMRNLQERCHFTSLEIFPIMIAVVALAERSLLLERTVTMHEQPLVEMERKL